MLMNENTAQELVLAAAMCHAAQIPSMVIASRVIRWDARTELNRRVKRVIEWTIPTLIVALVGSLLLHRRAWSSPLGVGLWIVVGGEALLRVRTFFERAQSAARAFTRSRQEIVFVLVGLGIVIAVNSREVVESGLGASVCLILALLYTSRTLIQVFAYARHWPSKRLLALAHWGLVLLFSLQTALYGATAAAWLGRHS